MLNFEGSQHPQNIPTVKCFPKLSLKVSIEFVEIQTQ